MKRYLIVLAVLTLASCSQEKKLFKQSTVYKIGDGGQAGKKTLELYFIDKNTIIDIDDKGKNLIISLPVDPDRKADTTFVIPSPTGFTAQMAISEEFYFAERKYDPRSNKPNTLCYIDSKFQMQAISVPFKFRSKIKDPKLKDSLPTQIETGFSLGFAAGQKFTLNVFNTKRNIFGANTNRYSFYPGAFVSFSTTDLKKQTTRYKIDFERKAGTISYGGFLMFGINNINIGYTIGVDNLLNKYKKDWVYNGNIWHGITVGLDIIKG